MLGVIRRFVPDSEDAEDILHDGFIVAMTRLDQLRDPDYIERWLATIMRNLALRFLHEQDISTMLDEMPEMMDSPELDGFIDLDTLESLIKNFPAVIRKYSVWLCLKINRIRRSGKYSVSHLIHHPRNFSMPGR